MDPEYLRRKEGRAARDDRREVMPKCVLTVSDNARVLSEQLIITLVYPYRKSGEDTQGRMELIGTIYLSTYDAGMDIL